jgi:hypothetical protein
MNKKTFSAPWARRHSRNLLDIGHPIAAPSDKTPGSCSRSRPWRIFLQILSHDTGLQAPVQPERDHVAPRINHPTRPDRCERRGRALAHRGFEVHGQLRFSPRLRCRVRHSNAEGIAGVLVSNGVEATPTDADGLYSLPVRDGVFVIKPAQWNLPFDLRTGGPAFSYRRGGGCCTNC